MAPTKDKRRAELVVPFRAPAPKKAAPSGIMSSSMPLAAMFMRNKLVGWMAIFMVVMQLMNEPYIKARSDDSQPAWLNLITSTVGLLTCYMDLVMPNAGRPSLFGSAPAAPKPSV